MNRRDAKMKMATMSSFRAWTMICFALCLKHQILVIGMSSEIMSVHPLTFRGGEIGDVANNDVNGTSSVSSSLPVSLADADGNDSKDSSSSGISSTRVGFWEKQILSLKKQRLQKQQSADTDDAASTVSDADNNNANDDENSTVRSNETSFSSSTTPPSIRLRPRVVSLNIMVAGLSGLGKTTTCANLLQSWLEQESSPYHHHPHSQTMGKSRPGKLTRHIDPSRIYSRYDIRTNTLLRVRIIDTPGFGNNINHVCSVQPITDYIEDRRREQYKDETSPKRLDSDGITEVTQENEEDTSGSDKLVHVCLYFLSPGRYLEIDRYFLSRVQKEVVIVPIIAKSDTLTNNEIASYRQEVVNRFQQEGIHPYSFDAHQNNDQGLMKAPFARGRRANEPLAIVARNGEYPWGQVECFRNAQHSDLRLIRDLLLSGHTEHFISLARDKYAVYRRRRIWSQRVSEQLKMVALGVLTIKAMGRNEMLNKYLSQLRLGVYLENCWGVLGTIGGYLGKCTTALTMGLWGGVSSTMQQEASSVPKTTASGAKQPPSLVSSLTDNANNSGLNKNATISSKIPDNDQSRNNFWWNRQKKRGREEQLDHTKSNSSSSLNNAASPTSSNKTISKTNTAAPATAGSNTDNDGYEEKESQHQPTTVERKQTKKKQKNPMLGYFGCMGYI